MLTIAIVQGFAAGAILMMLTDTMMPEAFRHGGAVAGLATTVGVRAGIPDRDGRARWIGIDHERTSGRGTQERGRHRAPYPGIGSVPGDARQLGDERPRAYGLIASAGAIAAVP